MTRPVLRPPDQRTGPQAAAPLLRRIAADPVAPLVATIVGPGGVGKTATLDAVTAAFQRAGVEVARYRARSLPDELDPDRPVLIDDAHRLDGRHLDPIRALVDSGAVRLVLAHRPWPRPTALQAAVAGGSAHRATVALGHLDRATVATRVAARLGAAGAGQPGRPGARAVRRVAGAGRPGHPGAVRRRPVRPGTPAGVPPARTGSRCRWRWPSGMRHHVDALDPPVQALLAALAVGAPLDLDVLRELLGRRSGRGAHRARRRRRGRRWPPDWSPRPAR